MKVLRGTVNVNNGGSMYIRGALTSCNGEHSDKGVYAPAIIRTKMLHNTKDTGAHITMMLMWAKYKVFEKLSSEITDVFCIYKMVDEFQSMHTDTDTWVLETVYDGDVVALKSRRCTFSHLMTIYTVSGMFNINTTISNYSSTCFARARDAIATATKTATKTATDAIFTTTNSTAATAVTSTQPQFLACN
eukprot:3414418-Ditylum_brightwellii.AAC.1